MTSREDQINAAAAWWRSLAPITTEDGRLLPGDRATLARLRRASSVIEAAAEPATVELLKALKLKPSDENIERTAVLAIILAHVRENAEEKIARALGPPPGGEPSKARLKPLRFRRLMAARTPDELLTAFRRVISILDRKANVKDLSRLILGWTDDEAGDRLRTRFAFDYYDAGAYAPPAHSNNSTSLTEGAD